MSLCHVMFGLFSHTENTHSGLKRLEPEAEHSAPSSAEVKNAWSYTSTPPIRFHGVLLNYGKAQGKIYFTLLYFTLLAFMSYINPKERTSDISRFDREANLNTFIPVSYEF